MVSLRIAMGCLGCANPLDNDRFAFPAKVKSVPISKWYLPRLFGNSRPRTSVRKFITENMLDERIRAVRVRHAATKLLTKIFARCGALKVPERGTGGKALLPRTTPGFNAFGWTPSQPDSKLHFASIKAMFWV